MTSWCRRRRALSRCAACMTARLLVVAGALLLLARRLCRSGTGSQSGLAAQTVAVAVEPVMVVADNADRAGVVRPIPGAARAVVVTHVRSQASPLIVRIAVS